MTNNEINIKFLSATDAKTRDEILSSVAKHYGITNDDALKEVSHEEAEHLLDYLTGDVRTATSLLMRRNEREIDGAKQIEMRLNALGFAMEYDQGSMPGEGHILLALSGEAVEPNGDTPAEVMALAKEWSDLADSRATESEINDSATVDELIEMPDAAQLAAVCAFRDQNGAEWKERLGAAWCTGKYGAVPKDQQPYLQQVRNQFGPEWLERVTDAHLITDELQIEPVSATPYEKCSALVEEMREKYPNAGLSFGYIGNLSVCGRHDDRSWMFFTQIPRPDRSDGLTFGSHGTDQLDALWDRAEHGFETFIRRALDPIYDAKCRVNDWRLASDAAKACVPGAIREKTYGGNDDLIAHGAVIALIKAEERVNWRFVPIWQGAHLTTAESLVAAQKSLDAAYESLPIAQKYCLYEGDKMLHLSTGREHRIMHIMAKKIFHTDGVQDFENSPSEVFEMCDVPRVTALQAALSAVSKPPSSPNAMATGIPRGRDIDASPEP